MVSPVLTRTRDLIHAYHWRWLDPAHNTEEIGIPALISPLRYDVIAIRDWLHAYNARPELRGDIPRVVAFARQTPYYQWVTSLYQLRFAARFGDPRVSEQRFAEIIKRSAALWEAMQPGFDRRFPIEIRVARRLLPAETGKRPSLRYILGDGSHRLACLMLQGMTKLPRDYYRLRWFRRYQPYDATWYVTSRRLLPEDHYFVFLSEVYSAPEAVRDRAAFMLFIKRTMPEREAEVRTILRVDGFPV